MDNRKRQLDLQKEIIKADWQDEIKEFSEKKGEKKAKIRTQIKGVRRKGRG